MAQVPSADGLLYSVDVDAVMSEPFPYFPISVNVLFELFTPLNPDEPQIITHSNETSLRQSNFNPAYPTRILIHGWNSRGSLTPRFAEAYFKKAQHKLNFIAVNWQHGAVTLNYPGARRRVNRVGPYVGQFIDFLVERGNLNLKDLVIIGMLSNF